VRPLERLLKASLSFGGTGGLDMGDSWLRSPLPLFGSGLAREERIDNDFGSYVAEAYKSNGIVFACVQARALAFSEVRFQYQYLTGGRPGKLWGDQSLSLLETPWPNGTTGELLMRMEQDTSLGGNFYATRIGNTIRRMTPDKVTIISGVRGDAKASPWSLNAEVLGYLYKPDPMTEATLLLPQDVVHYSPTPDPSAQWRGMSWLTPVINEIIGDSAATKHKVRFFKNGAMSHLKVVHPAGMSRPQFLEAVELFNAAHQGEANAYKTLHFGAGADASVMGADLKSVDFKAIQGAGETRIAAAAGVGAIMARLSEGMQGSSLNQGNYEAAKGQLVDMTIRPLWRTASASLSKFAAPPTGSRLWYDDRDVALLAKSATAAAEVRAKDAATVRTLVDAGFKPDDVIAAVTAGDLSALSGSHGGLFSVQLQAPGSAAAAPLPPAA